MKYNINKNEIPNFNINLTIDGSELVDYLKKQIGEGIVEEWSDSDFIEYIQTDVVDRIKAEFASFTIKVKKVD